VWQDAKKIWLLEREDMIQRIYIDTSVIGGLFDIEFSADTKPFFDRVEKGEIKIVYSEITTDELADAPEKIRNYFEGLSSKQKEFVEISQETINLADTYSGESCW
jgi:predicted nucleic acid-binding protein